MNGAVVVYFSRIEDIQSVEAAWSGPNFERGQIASCPVPDALNIQHFSPLVCTIRHCLGALVNARRNGPTISPTPPPPLI